MRAWKAIVVLIALIASIAVTACGGKAPLPTPTSTTREEILNENVPIVFLDHRELEEPEGVEVFANDPDAVLAREDGEVITSAAEQAAQGQTLLDCIGPSGYCTGDPVLAGDAIRVTDHRGWSDRIEALKASDPVIYGRVVEDEDGFWLVYILFFVYDRSPLIGDSLFGDAVAALGGDLVEHEGDLEAVALRVNARHELQEAIFTQHGSGERRTADELSLHDGRVGIFPSLGKHALLTKPGCHLIGVVPDCNRRGRQVEPALELIANQPWAFWPGVWGEVPTGPFTRWDKPESLLN